MYGDSWMVKYADLMSFSSDENWWYDNGSTLADFDVYEFLLKYNTTEFTMDAVNLTAMNFSEFDLEEWLEEYGIAERFEEALDLWSDNDDVFDLNDFDLNEYIEEGWGFGLEDYTEFFPMNTWFDSMSITDILNFILIDLCSDGTMEFGWDNFVHEAFGDYEPYEFLSMFNTTEFSEYDYNVTRDDFDFNSQDFGVFLDSFGMKEFFILELNDPCLDLATIDLNQLVEDFFGDEPLYWSEWKMEEVMQDILEWINDVHYEPSCGGDSGDSDWFDNFVIEYNDCYWYEIDCTEEEQRFYDCYWYDIACPNWESDGGFEDFV